MVGVGGLIVIGQVASHTSVRRSIVISIMTLRTVAGNGHMRPGQHVIVAVDGEGSRRPVGIGGMTGHAVCRNVDGRVIWIQRSIVIRHVATLAGIGSIVITTGMTFNTRYRKVSSG